MNIETRQAYSEVNMFLELIGEEMSNQIPLKLRKFFKREMDKNYIPTIDTKIPIKEQRLKRKTIAIIAGLNLQYWCQDEKRKKELLEVYSNNEKKYQEELREKYNPDDVFKTEKNNDYQLAFAETSEILKQLGKKYIDKIPKEVLNLIEEQKNKNINFKFDINKKIADQKIHNETLEVLAYINYNYWLDNNEKNKFEKVLQNNFNEIENDKRKKYNPDNIFKKTNNDTQELQIQVVKMSFWKKVIKRIGALIKK